MIDVPTATWAHPLFDIMAWSSGFALSVALYHWRIKLLAQETARKIDGRYFLSLAAGAAIGAWVAGSLNSIREHTPALSHSVAGALVGAIVGVEIYKAFRNVRGSTGGMFVGSFALGVVIGRLGCFFTGLPDDTYGSPAALPWAVNLGDGIPRHPVQLYESASMALFLTIYLIALFRRSTWAMRRGFYVMCIVYGVQRFAWEFLKPYPSLIGPLNIFHLLCMGLVIYGWVYYIADLRRERAKVSAVSIPRPNHEPLRDLP